MSHADHREVAVTDTEREDAGGEVPVRHRGPWNEADYRAVDDADFEGGRVELIDGALVIGPGPTADGDRAIARTRAALEGALPDGLCVVGPIGLRMGQDCVLLPDLVVMRGPAEGADDAETGTAAETGTDGETGTAAGTASDPVAVDTPVEAVVEAEEVLMVAEIVG